MDLKVRVDVNFARVDVNFQMVNVTDFFSSPGQSPGRAIEIPPASASELAKC